MCAARQDGLGHSGGFRPRFGPGPRTAVIAGITIWLAGYVPLSMSLLNRELLTGSELWISLSWGLAEACIATLAGAWIYRERAALLLALVAALSGGALTDSAIAAEPTRTTAVADTATFAGGCFWCMEPPFEALAGVTSVTSGYSGGPERDPTYAQVSAGRTGHMESIQVVFDPKKVTYARLLDVYWRNIDPTQADGQFCDHGTQYRSAIFYRGDAQRGSAERSRKAVENSRQLNQPIVTRIVRFTAFYLAESYHQNYYKKNPDHYHAYRAGCGRDRRLQALWGAAK